MGEGILIVEDNSIATKFLNASLKLVTELSYKEVHELTQSEKELILATNEFANNILNNMHK